MRDEEVCRYLAWDQPRSLDDTLALIRDGKDAMARGQSIVYAQVWNATGCAIGSTRLLDVRPADRQVEIGATFLAREFWRTPANTESKYLFLRHCFETLGCVRVALKTDGRNIRSQEAIARLRATREGALRRAHECEELRARHGVLLHHQRGVARSESAARIGTGTSCWRREAADEACWTPVDSLIKRSKTRQEGSRGVDQRLKRVAPRSPGSGRGSAP